MTIGKLGVFALVDTMSAQDASAFAQRVEGWGYGALWIPEAFGNPLVKASWLLARTTRLTLATGIANIYARDPLAALNAQYFLNEQSGGRFVLGLGVSHSPLVEGVRGHKYEKPLAAMRGYLTTMNGSEYQGPPPPEKPRTVIGALGPKMLGMAAELADGAHPYNVTPDHTAKARAIMGPGKLLCPEQMVLLETSPSEARALGRAVVGRYLGFPNYCNNFLRMGFTEADLAGGGSDRLVDALIAWGDENAIRRRIQEHWDAGADQVCIQVVGREGLGLSPRDEEILALLAPKETADVG